MNEFFLKEVTNPKEEAIFLSMPTMIYRGDKNWVRPLDTDIKGVFNPQKNQLFEGGEAVRWVLYNNKNMAVGRIAAFYNNSLADKGDCRAGGCGFFECIDDQQAANTLFDACVQWLEKRGLQAMDGSINFGERDQFWGVLVDGFYPPMYGSNYNLPYYQKLFEEYGFQNYFNQYSYFRELKIGDLSPAVIEKAKRLSENPDIEFRSLRKDEVDNIAEMFRSVYNRAWEAFDDVKKMTEEKAKDLLKMLKPIMDIDIVIFAFYKGEPIGFFITIPDINPAIKGLHGRFGLLEKLIFMYNLKIRKNCKVIQAIVFGVVPEFQGKGIESGMIMTLGDKMQNNNTKNYKHLELIWVGDFNPLMMRMVENYVCAKRYKQLITYRYMIDKSIEFKRAAKVSVSRKIKQ